MLFKPLHIILCITHSSFFLTQKVTRVIYKNQIISLYVLNKQIKNQIICYNSNIFNFNSMNDYFIFSLQIQRGFKMY